MSEPRAGRSAGLVGRGREFERIRRLIEAAAAGDGGALLVAGEAGVGKTVLLNEAGELAVAEGMRVLRAAGVEFEVDMPFSGLHQVLLPLLDELERLTLDQRDALNVALGFLDGEPPTRLVVCGAALTLLRQAAVAGPLFVTIDDLPWLDRASAAVVGFVARRLSGSPIGLLAASRAEEESLFEQAGLPELRLGPLDVQAARVLLQERAPGVPERVIQHVLAEARGNPLALLELPLAVRGGARSDQDGLRDAAPMGRRLQSLFAARVAEMPSGTRELLLRVALDGTGDLRVVHSLGASALEDLAVAERAQLVMVDGRTHQLVFRHPLMRSAVVELATEEERRAAHAGLAEVLVDQPERRAWHLGEATVNPDERVADLLEQAGLAILRRGDAVGSVATLTRASELSQAAEDRTRRLAQAAYIGAEATGDLDTASQLLSSAREVDPDLNRSLLAAGAAAFVLLNGEGDVDTAHRLLVGAITNYSDTYDTDDRVIVEALTVLVYICRYGSRERLWQPLRAAMARFSSAPPEALELMVAFSDPARTRALPMAELQAELDALRMESDPSQIIRLTVAAIYADRIAECEEALQRVILDGRAGGAVASAIGALASVGRARFLVGDWSHAVSFFEDSISLCKAHGYWVIQWDSRHHLATMAAARGDYITARSLADELVGAGIVHGAGILSVYASQLRSLIALGQGDYESVYRHATAINPGDTHPSQWAILDVVEAAVRTGRTTVAREWTDRIEQANVAGLSSRAALIAAGASAIACATPHALEMFEHALGLPEADRWPFERARIELVFGERLRRAQAPRESRDHLRLAFETFERLDARPWAERAATELRAAGGPGLRSKHRDRDALTPQEREIAALAASGLTNKQIGAQLYLSHKTVAFHLGRVFRKLGITSRAALRDALDALDALPDLHQDVRA